MSEAQKKARIKHESKRQIKKASFNTETEKELLEFANSVDFSKYVKSLILKEMEKMKFCPKSENVQLTVENLEFYTNKLAELNNSLQETIAGKHPEDALSLLIQIDDVLDTMKRWTEKHVTEGRAEKHWGAVARAKQREM